MKIPERKKVRGEMLPLMDMIFLLMTMFIFMVVRMRPDFGMTVELPKLAEMGGAAQKTQKEPETVWLAVTDKNELFVNKERAADRPAGLAILRRAIRSSPALARVILRGDRGSDFGTVVETYDWLVQSGYTNVLFDVEKEK
jgi:biopolymer transport protein ExbD